MGDGHASSTSLRRGCWEGRCTWRVLESQQAHDHVGGQDVHEGIREVNTHDRSGEDDGHEGTCPNNHSMTLLEDTMYTDGVPVINIYTTRWSVRCR